jgi:hypothetical protein
LFLKSSKKSSSLKNERKSGFKLRCSSRAHIWGGWGLMFFNIKSFKIVIENVQKLYEKTVPGGSRVGNGAAID